MNTHGMAHSQYDTDLAEGSLDQRLRECILSLLSQPDQGSICPTEVARVIADQLGCSWRDLMRPVRYVSGRLAEAGVIEIVQQGRSIHISEARGPVRLRLKAYRYS